VQGPCQGGLCGLSDGMRKDDDWHGPQPVFVLVRPQMGENIGAAARAMWNFGLERMRLVAPRDGWPNPRAGALASGASRVLDHVGVYDTADAAVADSHFVYATTARTRELAHTAFTPEAAMMDARARIADGQTVSVIFGPERAGLENDDIARANALIHVPVNPDFASLNLAQCVLLLAYEWRRQVYDGPQTEEVLPKTRPAAAIEVQKLQEHLEERLEDAHFFWPPEKAPHMRLVVRNMLSRWGLSHGDVQVLHGILRALGKDVIK
jgi:tRNA/rRNA methyltransferase